MRTYCTLFDKNYLYQGVALHESLRRFAGDFRLYALCMDSTAYSMMARMRSENLVPVSVDELITPEVSAMRDRTTHGQFCWVCQPLICEFVLNKYGHDMVTYLEADSLFFSDPEVLFQELGEDAVSLVPHSFSPGFDNTAEAGKFCVQFNAFRNEARGRIVLNHWKSSCFQYTMEKPLFHPGQTNLDDWPKRFDGVHALNHPGAGVAPWNIQHRKIETIDSKLCVDGVPIVFYHFHQYGRFENGAHELGYYPLATQVVNSVYRTYVRALREAEQKIQSLDRNFNSRRTYKNHKSLSEIMGSADMDDFREYVRVLKRKIRRTHNVFPDDYFSGDPARESGNA